MTRTAPLRWVTLYFVVVIACFGCAHEKDASKPESTKAQSPRWSVQLADSTISRHPNPAEMEDSDRALAEKVHQVITDAAPGLAPRLWYGMPAYAKDGKVLCFFQPAKKFKSRYATLGFNDVAALDDGAMWPCAYALTTLTAADEKKVRALIARAAG